MENNKTFYSVSEICNKFNISKYILLRYKKSGLINETIRNKYGYLLFDDEEVDKIGFIRFLQLIGFKIPEIVIIFNSKACDINEALNKKRLDLNSQIEKIKGNISLLDELLDANTVEQLIKIYNKKTGGHK